MTKFISYTTFTRWWHLALLIFVCYNAIWIPVLSEEDVCTWSQIFQGLAFDLIFCSAVALLNSPALGVIYKNAASNKWSDKHVGLMIIAVAGFNMVVCFPLMSLKWWLFNRIFTTESWNLEENYIDAYILSSISTIIVVSYMLISVNKMLRQKEKFLAEVKIKSIKNQINPHFLFNNLNTGIALIDYAPEKAIEFFTSMSRVFRTVLDRSMQSLQPLGDELKDLEQYLNLIHIRFGDALKIDCWISETESRRLIVSGVLQLIFENIVKHNKFSADNPIKVSVLTDGDTLMVINDFRPLSDKDDSHGIGQSAIIHRYEDFGKHNISFRQAGDKYISQIPLFPAK